MFTTAITITAYLMMGIILAVLLVRYFFSPFLHRTDGPLTLITAEKACPEEPSFVSTLKQDALWILGCFLLSRLFFFLLGGVCVCARNDISFLQYMQEATYHWTHWDAYHYIKLATDWYVNEGDDKFKLVFYPLYPAITMAVNQLFHNATYSAYFVSNGCLLGSCFVLYRLCERTMQQAGARRAVLFLLFAPMSFIFSCPMTEALFLLTTLGAAELARERRWVPALLCGICAALTRSLGLLAAVPIFYEMLRANAAPGEDKPLRAAFRPPYLLRTLLSALACCTVAIGFGLYLLLNWQVSGNPFQFLIYQSEHWSQTFGSVANTLSYTLNNAFEYSNQAYVTGTWFPQWIFLIAFLVIFLLCCHRIEPAFGAFAILYIYVSYAPTWLLSGPRYLTALFAVYPAMALLSEKRLLRWCLIALSCFGCFWMTWQFIAVGCVL